MKDFEPSDAPNTIWPDYRHLASIDKAYIRLPDAKVGEHDVEWGMEALANVR